MNFLAKMIAYCLYPFVLFYTKVFGEKKDNKMLKESDWWE